MGRVLGIDVGEKRLGIALSDPSGCIAQGLTILPREEGVFDKLWKMVETYQVEEVVVGLPLNLNASWGESARGVAAFQEKLQQFLPVPVRLWDERLSTVAAEKALLEANLSRRQRKKLVDQVAAVIILQSYLEYKKAKGSS